MTPPNAASVLAVLAAAMAATALIGMALVHVARIFDNRPTRKDRT